MNRTAITNRPQNSFKITCTDHRIIEILGLRPSNRSNMYVDSSSSYFRKMTRILPAETEDTQWYCSRNKYMEISLNIVLYLLF